MQTERLKGRKMTSCAPSPATACGSQYSLARMPRGGDPIWSEGHAMNFAAFIEEKNTAGNHHGH